MLPVYLYLCVSWQITIHTWLLFLPQNQQRRVKTRQHRFVNAMYRCLRKHRALAACLFTALISSLTIALWSDRLWPLLISRLSLCSRSDSKFRLSRIRTQSSPAWLKNQVWLGQTEPIGLVVDTPSCQIPDFDAYNPSIRPYVRDPDPKFIVCNHSLPVTVTDGQYIRLNTTLAESLHIRHCFYQQVRWLTHLLYQPTVREISGLVLLCNLFPTLVWPLVVMVGLKATK